jgi:hypothetical protein
MSNVLIIHHDQDCKAYFFDGSQIELIGEIKKTERTLELSQRFEEFWKDLWKIDKIKPVKQIYLVLGTNAGFTDSRIIFIWLKTWHTFQPELNSYFVTKINSDHNLDGYNKEQIITLLTESVINPPDLTYIREPRITLKNQ